MIPSIINNRYKIVKVLAEGGFGKTFLTEDTHLPSGRQCVVKQLKPIADNPQIYKLVQDRFQREQALPLDQYSVDLTFAKDKVCFGFVELK